MRENLFSIMILITIDEIILRPYKYQQTTSLASATIDNPFSVGDEKWSTYR